MPIFKNVTENSSGNVGIGTTSPTYRVSTQGTGDHRIYHYNSGTTTSDNAIIQAEVAGDNSGNAFFCAGKTGTVWSLGRNTSTGNFEIRSNFNLANDASSRMIIKTDGSVGIGTTNPSRKVHIYSTDDTRGILIHNTSTTSYAELHLSASREYRIGTGGSSADSSAANNFYVYDLTAAAHRFTINSSGNVGIGTTNPSSTSRLHIAGSTQDNITIFYTGTSGGHESGIRFEDFRGQQNAFIGNNLDNDGVGVAAAHMVFKTTTGGTLSERMRITTGGNVGIGTTNPGEKFHVEGALRVLSNGSSRGIYIRAASANTGNIIQFEENDGTQLWEIVGRGYSAAYPFYIYKTSGTGSGYRYYINSSGNHTFTGDVTVTGTITESSSKTIKQNINPITDALSIINSITGYTYDRKDGTATNQSGFIAEEVAEVLPGVVSLDQEGNPTGVQYTKIIAYLVESIKELKSELDELKRQ